MDLLSSYFNHEYASHRLHTDIELTATHYANSYMHSGAPPQAAMLIPNDDATVPNTGGMHSMIYMDQGAFIDSPRVQERGVRRRVTANKKERRRTVSINSAFSSLRSVIPNVPTDTKLSKIKTLRLAANYIAHLSELLEKPDGEVSKEFRAEVAAKETRSEKRKRSTRTQQSANGGAASERPEKKRGSRTGWPSDVWANELTQTASASRRRE